MGVDLAIEQPAQISSTSLIEEVITSYQKVVNTLMKEGTMGDSMEPGKVYRYDSENLVEDPNLPSNIFYLQEHFSKSKDRNRVLVKIDDQNIMMLGNFQLNLPDELNRNVTYCIGNDRIEVFINNDDEYLLKVDGTSLWAKLRKVSGVIFGKSTGLTHITAAQYLLDKNPQVNSIKGEWSSDKNYDTNTQKFYESREILLKVLDAKDKAEFISQTIQLLEGYFTLDNILKVIEQTWQTPGMQELVKTIAALSTWSGRQADSLGFGNRVEVHDENVNQEIQGKDIIYTYFYAK